MTISASAALETIERYSSPVAKTKPTAAVIWLHGLGADGYDFADIVPAFNIPAPHAVRFIFPHAPIQPITLNGGTPMRAWFDIYALDRLAEIDLKGVVRAEQAIRKLIEQQLAAGIPSNKIFLAGFSQGGAMSLFCGLQFPQPLAGLIALSTFLPISNVQNYLLPHITRSNQQTPIFMAHGTEDALISCQSGEMTANTLKKLDYSVIWKTYPMAHTVCSQEIADINGFFQKYL